MKTELYHYAMSLNSKELSETKTPNLCIWILLSVFLIPILISNIWIGLITASSYIVLCLCVKRENDKYGKELLNSGLFMLFLGIEGTFLLIIQYKIIKLLMVTIFILLVVYEIIFAFKIKLKSYSQKDKSKRTWINVLSLICGGTGVWFGKMLANIPESNEFKLWIAIISCSVVIVGSVSFFQKYLIYKVVKT